MHRRSFVRGLPTLAFHGINSDSAGNYQLIDEECTGRISSADCQHSQSLGTNSDSAGNYQLMEADSDREDQNVRKILKAVTISGSASSNPIYCKGQLKKKNI
jgi:hypothetical protein